MGPRANLDVVEKRKISPAGNRTTIPEYFLSEVKQISHLQFEKENSFLHFVQWTL
jgi:hypothetical protein